MLSLPRSAAPSVSVSLPALSVGALTLVIALVMSVLGPVSPATAATARMGDARDAAAAQDTRRVALDTDQRGRVVVTLRSPTYRVGKKFNGVEVRYDTTGNKVGDFRLIWGFTKDGDGFRSFTLYRARGQRLVARVPCPAAAGRGRQGNRIVTVAVPRRCLAVKKPVGVSVMTWDWTRYDRKRVPLRGNLDRTPNQKSRWLR